MTKRKCFSQAIVESISKIIGETVDGYTGSEIELFLAQCSIPDISPGITKWKRLYSALANIQNIQQCSNSILRFIGAILAPARNIDKNNYKEIVQKVNVQLALVGYIFNESGKFSESTSPANSVSEAQKRVNKLKHDLEERGVHKLIFQCCKAELMTNNYFHAVFESSKALIKRIQDISGVLYDGQNLIEHVFRKNNPILIINNYQTRSEKDEHNGFKSILIGICNMFRNPEAHELKTEWIIEEQDALDILSMISYCHRRLDKAQKINI